MLMDFKKRRSIRKYLNKPIEKEKLDRIIDNVLIAPSSRNRKPWKFVVVSDESILLKLSQSREHGSSFLKDAPLAIVVVSDAETSDVWIEDASIAALTIQLTAHELGLVSCWVQVRDRMKSDVESTEDYIKKVLKIPEKLKIECVIALGYGDEEKQPYTGKDMDFSKIHYNTYKA